jgi:alpha-glucosidase (family GH31 glycosyl hydrolase)
MLGDAFLVAPLLDASEKRDVAFPAGANYYDFFQPASNAISGGTTITGYGPPTTARIGLFVREGAIVPLEVGEDTTGLGSAMSAGKATFLVYPGAQQSSFKVHDDDGMTTVVTAQAMPGPFAVNLSRTVKDTILRIRAENVATVSVNGIAVSALATAAAFDAAQTGYYVDTSTRTVWIHVPQSSAAVAVTST